MCLLKIAPVHAGPKASQQEVRILRRADTLLPRGAQVPRQRIPLSVGEMLHCNGKELTFRERAAWFPSGSCI